MPVSLSVIAQNVEKANTSITASKVKLDTLFKQIRKLMRNGEFDSSERLINQSLLIVEKMGIDSLRAKFYLEKANIYGLRGDKKKSLDILHQTSAWITQTTPYPIRDKYYNLSASCHRTLLQYDSALYYLEEDEKLNNVYNPYWNWLVYYQMALTFMQARLPVEAEKYFEQSYQLTKANGKRADFGVLLNEYAFFLLKTNKPEKFSIILSEYNKLLRTSKRDFTQDPIHSMLFKDWTTGTTSEKLQFMTTVKESLLRNGDTFNTAYANNFIAKIYEDNNQAEEAYKYIQQNLGPYKPVNHPEYQYINNTAAYRLLKKMGRHEEAVQVADQLFRLRDTIIVSKQRETILALEAKYQSEKKEKEISLLNSQNALNEARLLHEIETKKRLQIQNIFKDSVLAFERSYSKLISTENVLKDAQLQKEMELKSVMNREKDLISQQNLVKEIELQRAARIRSLLIGGAILLLFSAATILYLYSKQKSKNLLIQKQADELEVLMKEIHHRVKNNMQIVSSLLDLQSNSIVDNQAAEAVKEGKNRVQSMAIIHQHLYLDGNVRAIKMNDYIKTLTENLYASYNIDPQKIKLLTDVENINLDIDTVIPIGLIINELVSNSLKYAFKGIEVGTLTISLKDKLDHLELRVKDNGKGFPVELQANRQNSFGLRLIAAFAQKLKAKLDIYNDNGAVVFMQIKKYKIAG